MLKKFKNIYIEIINTCNLNCSFCPKTRRTKKTMGASEFSYVLDKLIDYAEYFYLHVVGEPLFSPYINDILTCCDKKNAKIKLTTNGVLLKNKLDLLINHPCLNAVNISLSCLKDFNLEAANAYINDVFKAAKLLSKQKIRVTLRTWTSIDYFYLIKERIQAEYDKEIIKNSAKIQKICDYLLFDTKNEFVWPIDSKNNLTNLTDKTCLGLRKQLAVLCDGSVVPCCLDSEGILTLGNIFTDSLKTILNTPRAKNIAEGFNSCNAVEPFCQTCTFKA